MSNERACSACGRVVRPEDRFCGGCGAPLGKRVPLPGLSRPALDEMFAHLRSGEQRPAAILMTDISGFSRIGEHVEPEWLFHLINQVFEELVDCLVAHGAHIDKYVGDEVVALFGVPVAQERSAERAILAALAMHQRLGALKQQGQFGDTPLDIHTGINVGRVMVGPVGHRAYAEYTVIGDAVNVAKRLEEEAPAGQIYVSRAVCDAVGDAFELEATGPLGLAGRRGQVEAFRVAGARQSHVRREQQVAMETAGHTRTAELQRIADYCEEAKAGDQRCVCIVGPPGIGKSQLIAEWSQSASAGDFGVVSSACHAYGEHFPLLPVADVIARLVGLHLEGWPPRVAGDPERAIAELPVHDEARTHLLALLRSVDQPPMEAIDDWPEDVCGALAALLTALTARGPVCLVLEDVQWLDEASRGVLTGLLADQRSWALAVILSAREPVPDWLTDAAKTLTIRLEPLPQPVMERLVREWVGGGPHAAGLVRTICARAQGHPYFARELARSLKQVAPDTSEPQASLPDTLEELFLAQLDQLPLPLRRLVRGASVLGEPLSPHLLEAAMGEETQLTDALLGEARAQGLLRVGRVPGQFVFGRRLLFEAAYVTIPPGQRSDLHARVATQIVAEMESLGGAAIHAAAHHAYLGYHDERAIDLLVACARQYRAQYANRQAILSATRGLELIDGVPPPDRFSHQRLEALLLLAQSYQVVGDHAQARNAVDRAQRLTGDCGDRELVAKIVTCAATLYWMEGDSLEAEQRFARAYELWEELANDTRAAQALVGMGLCATQHGERTEALELFSRAADRENTEEWVKAAALNNLGVMLLQEGRYAEAEPYLVEGLHANERDGDRRGVAQSKCSLGELCYRLARFADAERWLSETVSEAGDIEDVQCLALANGYLRRVQCLTGTPPEAEVCARMAVTPEDIQDAQAEMLCRLAEVEAGLLSAAGEERSALLHELSAAHGPIRDPSPAPTDWNPFVEILCVGVEFALVAGESDAAQRMADRLAQHSGRARDRHLRRYAEWLLHVTAGGDRATGPMPLAESGEHTVFDVRSQRISNALGRGQGDLTRDAK